MTKKEMYTIPLPKLSTETCEVMQLMPRSVIADYSDLPSMERLAMIRGLVADAAKRTWRA